MKLWKMVYSRQIDEYEIGYVYQHRIFRSKIRFIYRPTLKGVSRILKRYYWPGLKEALDSPSLLWQMLKGQEHESSPN